MEPSVYTTGVGDEISAKLDNPLVPYKTKHSANCAGTSAHAQNCRGTRVNKICSLCYTLGFAGDTVNELMVLIS